MPWGRVSDESRPRLCAGRHLWRHRITRHLALRGRFRYNRAARTASGFSSHGKPQQQRASTCVRTRYQARWQPTAHMDRTHLPLFQAEVDRPNSGPYEATYRREFQPSSRHLHVDFPWVRHPTVAKQFSLSLARKASRHGVRW